MFSGLYAAAFHDGTVGVNANAAWNAESKVIFRNGTKNAACSYFFSSFQEWRRNTKFPLLTTAAFVAMKTLEGEGGRRPKVHDSTRELASLGILDGSRRFERNP